MLDIDELKYTLENHFERVETETEMMRFCSVLLNYANGICSALADDKAEEEAENDTDIG